MTSDQAGVHADAVLQAVGVSAGYRRGRNSAVLHDIDLVVRRGRTIGILGESGSGKSTLARVLVGQLRPVRGRVLVDDTDLGSLRSSRLRRLRRRVQLIPQDANASLDPRMTIFRTLDEAISPLGRARADNAQRVADLLRAVALDPDIAERYPRELSGGQRQRIAIARALAVEPEVLIADEITSSLDSSAQAEILNLLASLQRHSHRALVFITHNLAVAEYMSDDIAVLYLGRVVEQGGPRLLSDPAHPYTRLLVDSVPQPTADWRRTTPVPLVQNDAPDPTRPPTGCPFHPRCPSGPRVRADRAACCEQRPELHRQKHAGNDDDPESPTAVACHFPLTDEAAGEFLTRSGSA